MDFIIIEHHHNNARNKAYEASQEHLIGLASNKDNVIYHKYDVAEATACWGEWEDVPQELRLLIKDHGEAYGVMYNGQYEKFYAPGDMLLPSELEWASEVLFGDLSGYVMEEITGLDDDQIALLVDELLDRYCHFDSGTVCRDLRNIREYYED